MPYKKQRAPGFKNGRPLYEDKPPRQKKQGESRAEGRSEKPKAKFAPKREDGPRRDRFDQPGKLRPYPKDEERRPRTAPQEMERRPKPVPQEPVQDDRELPLILYGRNPVREAIKSGRSIDRILVTAAGAEDGSLRELVRMARDAGIVVSEVTKQKLDEMTLPYGYAGKPANHQGIIARMPECQYVEVEDLLAQAKEKGEDPFLIVLDSISDPHNLGSIMRSALCAGAHGVIIPKRRAASVTASAGKASAGAVAYLPVARVANLSNTIEELKKAGLWICGADAAGKPMTKCDMKGPFALIIGSEDEGISRILREKCDFLASIPMKGPLDSLNASVAAAVLMFEKVRQDTASKCI
ncbi:MAG: 23S rRNA (guanosine(2251)-2'-O)-methyltransferase RlmB [Christensenellales bacterium]